MSVAVGLDRVLHLAENALAVDRLVATALAGERHPHAVYHFARRLRIESCAVAFVVDKPVLVAHPVAGPDVREPVVVGLHIDLAAAGNGVVGAQANVRRAFAARHVQRAPCLDQEGVVGPHEGFRGVHVNRRTAAGAGQAAMGAFFDLKDGIRSETALGNGDGNISAARAGGHFELVRNLDSAIRLDHDLRKAVRVASAYLVRLVVAGDVDLAGARVVRPAVAACVCAFNDLVAVDPQRDVREVVAVALPLGVEGQVAGAGPGIYDGAAVFVVAPRAQTILARVPALEGVAVTVRLRSVGVGVAELGQQVRREARTVIKGDRVFDGGVRFGRRGGGRARERRGGGLVGRAGAASRPLWTAVAAVAAVAVEPAFGAVGPRTASADAAGAAAAVAACRLALGVALGGPVGSALAAAAARAAAAAAAAEVAGRAARTAAAAAAAAARAVRVPPVLSVKTT